MKAAYIEATGSPDVIRYGDLPTPEPKQGEALVRVSAAALNPVDLYVRAGTVQMPLPFPFVTGCDLAGTVERVGPGAGRFQPGDRVWGSNQGLLGRQGTFAEYAAVAEDWLYPTPDNVADTTAAAVALVGITAHLGLFRDAHLQAGETVFVNGGTGGVGSMVVQMSKAVGASVITTVGSADKAKKCSDWGADCVLNYKTDDVAARVRSFCRSRGLHSWYDLVHVWYETQREPDFERTIDLMAQRGRIIVIAGRQARPVFPVGPFYVKGLSLHGFAMFNAAPAEQRRCADDINRWLAEGKLKPPIGRVFPLAETAEAHRFLEANTLHGTGTLVGKVLVKP
jgi:NADPH2:quinone reductase